MPAQKVTQYDKTLYTYDTETHAEAALSVNLYQLVKDHPAPPQYEFSIPIVVAANSRRKMGYTVFEEAEDFIDIGNAKTVTLGDNGGVWVDIETLGMPWSFLHYGHRYDEVFITSNGFISFDNRSYNDNGGQWTSPNPASIPTTDDPNIITAPFWRDLDPSKGGTIKYGDGPASSFAVVWDNVYNKANNNRQTFAVYLYPDCVGDDEFIAFIYGSITNDVPTSIGIEDHTGKRGSSVSSVSSGQRVEFIPWPDNYYRITKIEVSASKLTISGANNDKARIYIEGWEESRPGGTNLILEDPSEGKFDVPVIITAASFVLSTAALLGPGAFAYLGYAGYVISAATLAYELSPLPRGTTVHEADENTKTAYVKSAARDENYPFYDRAYDVSLSPLIRWRIVDPSVSHRLVINAKVTIQRPWTVGGGEYTFTTDSIELKLTPHVNLPPEAPSKPDGPKTVYRMESYYYETSVFDPEGDDVLYEVEVAGEGTNRTSTTPYVESGEAVWRWRWYWRTEDPPGTYQMRMRAQDRPGLWSDWSQPLTITLVNRPPNTPSTPDGPTTVYRGELYWYNTSTTDPDRQDVRYQIEVTHDDGGYLEGVIGWHGSGETVSFAIHYFESDPGTYQIRARAQDPDMHDEQLWSDWSQPLTVTLVGVHDVAVTDVTTILPYGATEIYPGWTANFSVTVENCGDYDETFIAQLKLQCEPDWYYLMQQQASVSVGHSETVIFTWDTEAFMSWIGFDAGEMVGDWNITAYARWILVGDDLILDDDATNSMLYGGIVTIRKLGDVNGDGNVSMADMVEVDMALGSQPGDPNWNPYADVNCDGSISIADIVLVDENLE